MKIPRLRHYDGARFKSSSTIKRYDVAYGVDGTALQRRHLLVV